MKFQTFKTCKEKIQNQQEQFKQEMKAQQQTIKNKLNITLG